MFDTQILALAAVFAAIALAFLAFSRNAGGLLCVLAASYCGVIIISFTRGTSGAILLPQVFLYLLAPVVLFRSATGW